jgi:hypothetical protein
MLGILDANARRTDRSVVGNIACSTLDMCSAFAEDSGARHRSCWINEREPTP